MLFVTTKTHVRLCGIMKKKLLVLVFYTKYCIEVEELLTLPLKVPADLILTGTIDDAGSLLM